MVIDRNGLFERTKALWPAVIEKENVPPSSNLAQTLIDLYNKIESSLSDDDHWMQISIWAYHQSLFKNFVEGSTQFSTQQVEFEEFNRMMVQNLDGDECWVNEREQWMKASKK